MNDCPSSAVVLAVPVRRWPSGQLKPRPVASTPTSLSLLHPSPISISPDSKPPLPPHPPSPRSCFPPPSAVPHREPASAFSPSASHLPLPPNPTRISFPEAPQTTPWLPRSLTSTPTRRSTSSMCAPQAPRASCEAIVPCITANPSDSDPSGAEVKHVRTDRPGTTLPAHDQAEHELTLF